MNKQYAVFDWDNTVRDGFTLFDWIDYLVNRGVLTEEIQVAIDTLSDKYKAGLLSHDEYAHLACKTYAKGINGLRVDFIMEIAHQYIEQDRCHIFHGMEEIFGYLKKSGIEVMVISGAPKIILDFYKKKFHIREIFAFKERVENGRFAGRASYNYGYNKKKTIAQLKDKYGTKPLLGFGDSDSDIPLLKEATYAFSINTNIENAMRIDIVNHSIQKKYIDQIIHIMQTNKKEDEG